MSWASRPRAQEGTAAPTALAAGLALALLLALPEAGEAGIYKCVGPDGKTTFTSDPGACPGAKPHELKAKVQRVVDPPVRRRARPAASRRSVGSRDDGLERMWRQRRPQAQAELGEVEQAWQRLEVVVRSCNRGDNWYRTDASGIKRRVDCSDLKDSHQAASQRRKELHAYLNGGLEEECRRAGCKPGWIR